MRSGRQLGGRDHAAPVPPCARRATAPATRAAHLRQPPGGHRPAVAGGPTRRSGSATGSVDRRERRHGCRRRPPGRPRPPPYRTSSAAAASAADRGDRPGRRARSNRRDASYGNLCRRAAREITGWVPPGRLDDDIGGVGGDLGALPAHHAGQRDRRRTRRRPPGRPATRVRTLPSSVRQRLAGRRAAHRDVAGELAGVEGVQRLAVLDHHVVGDVHRQRDAAGCRPAASRRRIQNGGGAAGSTPGHPDGDEPVAAAGSAMATGQPDRLGPAIRRWAAGSTNGTSKRRRPAPGPARGSTARSRGRG